MKLGVVLPQFRDDADGALTVARTAEAGGLDGVFVFDHLWPIGQPDRPALHGMTLLGAVAAETTRIAVGTLVARVSLLPNAVLVHGFETLRRIVGDRLIAGIGAGDRLSEPENVAYGIELPPAAERLRDLADCADRLHASSITTWIGGLAPRTRAVAAAHADVLNLWGVDAAFVADVVAEMAASGTEVTWGGQVDPDQSAAALAGHLSTLRDAGATWAVVAGTGPSGGERVVELLTEAAQALR